MSVVNNHQDKITKSSHVIKSMVDHLDGNMATSDVEIISDSASSDSDLDEEEDDEYIPERALAVLNFNTAMSKQHASQLPDDNRVLDYDYLP